MLNTDWITMMSVIYYTFICGYSFFFIIFRQALILDIAINTKNYFSQKKNCKISTFEL